MLNPTTIARETAQAVALILGLRWGIEEADYEVEDRTRGVEIRRYGPRIAAETVVRADDDAARNIGFRRLASYIFGANQRATKISMTAPVAQLADNSAEGQMIAMTAPVAQARNQTGQSVIRFFMPAEWKMDALPEPSDESVKLVDVAPETSAVVRFTGDRSPATVRRRIDSLLQILTETDYEAVGAPVTWLYDPPFTLPFRRRNEVAVPVLRRR